MSDVVAITIPVVLFVLIVGLAIVGVYRAMVAEERALQQREDR